MRLVLSARLMTGLFEKGFNNVKEGFSLTDTIDGIVGMSGIGELVT